MAIFTLATTQAKLLAAGLGAATVVGAIAVVDWPEQSPVVGDVAIRLNAPETPDVTPTKTRATTTDGGILSADDPVAERRASDGGATGGADTPPRETGNTTGGLVAEETQSSGDIAVSRADDPTRLVPGGGLETGADPDGAIGTEAAASTKPVEATDASNTPIPETETAKLPKTNTVEALDDVAEGSKAPTPLVEAQDLSPELGLSTDPSLATPKSTGLDITTTPPDQLALLTEPTAKPVVKPAESTLRKTDKALKIDLVRVDPTGMTVLAGKATPGDRVDVHVDGVAAGSATADQSGNFVALLDVAPKEEPQMIALSTQAEDGSEAYSADRVLIMGRELADEGGAASTETEEINTTASIPVDERPADTTPAVIIASDEGVKLAQPAEVSNARPDVVANVSIDLITYDEAGEVRLEGRAKADGHVRVYVNDRPVKTQPVTKNGTWNMDLSEVPPGRYTLRIDELDADGKVVSRVETPFQKEESDLVRKHLAELATPSKDAEFIANKIQKVTIQKGHTLWAIARDNYGDGMQYWLIYRANKRAIRNPDLIYPGQIFTIPN